jgi:broad specificity phosphatase PhoE
MIRRVSQDLAGWTLDPNDPRAPSQEPWDRLTPRLAEALAELERLR